MCVKFKSTHKPCMQIKSTQRYINVQRAAGCKNGKKHVPIDKKMWVSIWFRKNFFSDIVVGLRIDEEHMWFILFGELKRRRGMRYH